MALLMCSILLCSNDSPSTSSFGNLLMSKLAPDKKARHDLYCSQRDPTVMLHSIVGRSPFWNADLGRYASVAAAPRLLYGGWRDSRLAESWLPGEADEDEAERKGAVATALDKSALFWLLMLLLFVLPLAS